MGFGFLHEATGERRFLERINHFLEKPLITTTPYVYEALIKTLGVFTCLHYPLPVHLQHCYRDWGYAVGSLPVTEAVASSILSLPMFPGFYTRAAIAGGCWDPELPWSGECLRTG